MDRWNPSGSSTRGEGFRLTMTNRTHLKIRVFVRDQGEAEDQSAGILQYVEDLKRSFNADIGRKYFFEKGSKQGNL
jgi:hypothetical protein